MAIALYEDFDNPVGMFPNYDAYDSNQRAQLPRQKHVDIRSFESAVMIGYTMAALDRLTNSGLDTLTQIELETGDVIYPDEGWTSPATFGPAADRNHFNCLTVPCILGITTTSSVLIETTGIKSIDLSSFSIGGISSLPLLVTSGDDYLSLSLPAFPGAHLDLANTFLDLTSDPSADFAAGPFASLAFTQNRNGVTSANNGVDVEIQFPLGLLEAIDRSRITGVRFRITATSPCSVRCLAIRAFAETWEFAPVDQNTLYDRFQATVPPSGSLAQGYTFPAASGGTWPVLWRADPTNSDPTPVDMEVGTVIHTGSAAAPNTFALYFREIPTIPCDQADLDGQSMAQLESPGVQPDAANPGVELVPDTMSDLDQLHMTNLADDTMNALERGHRGAQTRYIRAALTWGPGTSATVLINDQLGVVSYPFTTSLSAGSDYYLLVMLYDNSLRVQIYPLSGEGYIIWSTPVFDSTAIIDRGLVPRRKGRFGWWASLGDGDASIKRLRPRYVVHNEYLSLPFWSETPVEGAQLQVGASPDAELYDGATSATGLPLSLDPTKSRSGHCLRVFCDGSAPNQGLHSAPMRIENLAETRIEFDVLAPLAARLTPRLVGEGRYILLNLPPLPDSHWAHVAISLDTIGALYQPGVYQFQLIQSNPVQSTWWIDNLTIPTRAVAFGARQAADPWRMRDPDFTPFADTLNQPYDGALIDRGNQLQIRGRGLTPDAAIDHLTILPKYAELGKPRWEDQEPTYQAAPTGSVPAPTIFGLTTTFAATMTAANGADAFYWAFGDGSYGYGATVTHTYPTSGSYTVSLIFVDQLHLQTMSTRVITV